MTQPHSPEQSVRASLARHVRPGDTLCVGLSGGLDSVALLDILVGCAAGFDVALRAMHVNHHLHPGAGEWTAFCRTLCANYGVPLDVADVAVARDSGLGIEAAAREARYAAYRTSGARWIVLAHHADDVAETVLLRILRGAGVKGLAAVPETRALSAAQQVLRPLRSATRAELDAYAVRRGLEWIEDTSNADERLDRNFIRRRIMAPLRERFPDAVRGFARTAGHAAEAQVLLDALGRVDGGVVAGSTAARLSVAALRNLSEERARNALRVFLADRGAAMPDAPHLCEAIRQIRAGGASGRLLIHFDGVDLRRHGDALLLEPPAAAPVRVDVAWRGEVRLAIPQLSGAIEFHREAGRGIAAERTAESGWAVRTRAGGEHLRLDKRRPNRTFKNLMQEHRIPAWQRERLPLLFHGDRLVWIAGVGVDCEYHCADGAMGVTPVWNPDVAPRRA